MYSSGIIYLTVLNEHDLSALVTYSQALSGRMYLSYRCPWHYTIVQVLYDALYGDLRGGGKDVGFPFDWPTMSTLPG